MKIIYTPDIGGKLRRQISESQNHRCAVCTRPITPYDLCEFEDSAATVKFDRSKNKTYDNSVAVCQRCAGEQGNYGSLVEFYEAFVAGTAFHRKKRPATVYPETIPLVREILFRKTAEAGKLFSGHIPLGFQFAPPEMAEKIAIKLFTNILDGLNVRKRGTSKRNAFLVRQAYKRCFMESQNHRCCYCGIRLTTTFADDPDYATWEHVQNLRDEGSNRFDNLVIACSLCNATREALKLSAEAYFEWVVENRDDLEVSRARQRRAAERKRLTHPHKHERMMRTRHPREPLFAHE